LAFDGSKEQTKAGHCLDYEAKMKELLEEQGTRWFHTMIEA
jgi:hypothetical protein